MVTQIMSMQQRPVQQSSATRMSSSLSDVASAPVHSPPYHAVVRTAPAVVPSTPLPSTFPVFSADGDVSINISSTNGLRHRRYLLHRHVLRQSSGFFRRDLAGSATRSHNGCYTLDRDSATSAGTPRLVWFDHSLATSTSTPDLSLPPLPTRQRKPIASRGTLRRTVASQASLVSSGQHAMNHINFDDDVFKDYDNLLRIFYNLPPALDSENVATAYTECKALLYLAESYDALDVVGPRLDHHLLCFGNRLFRQIAKYPPSYLKLGLLAKSKVIFSEALTHVVGQWPRARPQLETQLPSIAMNLVLEKVDALEQAKQKIERKLLMLNVKSSTSQPCTPANDLIAWLATSLFRQWLVERIAASKVAESRISRIGHGSPARANTSVALPQSSSIFLTLAATDGQAYLSHDDCRRFFKASALNGLYTKETFRHFESTLDELKDMAREIVRPLARINLQLSPVCVISSKICEPKSSRDKSAPWQLDHLTCTRVSESELPWAT